MVNAIMIFVFLAMAGFLAGLIDSIAGGGGLIGLPALLAAGVPAHMALGTTKFQSMLGTVFALANFTRKLKVVWKVAAIGLPCSFIGSMGGAKLALLVSPTVLAKIIIILLPPVTAFIFLSSRLLKTHIETKEISGHNLWLVTPTICLTIGLYDGFFGPGAGTFFIIALVIFSHLSLVSASATAKTFNLASNLGAFVTFVASGQVYYPYAIIMAIANIVGNILGSHLAIKHGHGLVKKILLISLTLLFAYLIWKYLI